MTIFSDYKQLNDSNDEEELKEETNFASKNQTFCLVFPILILLLFSMLLNIIFYLRSGHSETGYLEPNYAGLGRDIPVPINNDNRSLYDDVWIDTRYDMDIGVIAVDKEYIQKHDLLPTQPFPWDKSKGIYLLNSFHALHCVKAIRQVLIDARQGDSWTWSLEHISHCLATLRDDVTCHADDFPRYTGAYNAEKGNPRPSPGTGAVRMCRDWDKLLRFANENSACYRRTGKYTPTLNLERYKFCPDGSKPWIQSI